MGCFVQIVPYILGPCVSVQESMRRIKGVLRDYVLQESCSAAGGYPEGAMVETDSAAGVRNEQCWADPFLVDIRYDTSTDEVCVECLF